MHFHLRLTSTPPALALRLLFVSGSYVPHEHHPSQHTRVVLWLGKLGSESRGGHMLMRDSMGNDRKDAPIGKQIKPRHRPEAVPAEVPACPIFVWEIYLRGWRMDTPEAQRWRRWRRHCIHYVSCGMMGTVTETICSSQ